uniref:Secreted protein n=1 Tax=Rhipicephalus microplus TaxID=6941 RepID=A0A6G5AFZ0_RHIMP
MNRTFIGLTCASAFSFFTVMCVCVWSVHDYTDLTATDNSCEFYLPSVFAVTPMCAICAFQKNYSNVDKIYLFYTISHDTLLLCVIASTCFSCQHLTTLTGLWENHFLRIYRTRYVIKSCLAMTVRKREAFMKQHQLLTKQ